MSRDERQIDQHPRDTSQCWIAQAEENIDDWGQQSAAALVLALQEELGEIAAEMLGNPIGVGDLAFPPEAYAQLEAVQDAGFYCRRYLESEFETDDGEPLPAAERPDLRIGFDSDDLRAEIDDLAPLVYQLRWALDGDQS